MDKCDDTFAGFSVQIHNAKLKLKQTVQNLHSILDGRELELIEALDQIEGAYYENCNRIMKDISALEEMRSNTCCISTCDTGLIKSAVDQQMCRLTASLKTKNVKVDFLPNIEEIIVGFATIKVEDSGNNSPQSESKRNRKTRSRTSVALGEEKSSNFELSEHSSTNLDDALCYQKVAITAACQGNLLQSSRRRTNDGSPATIVQEKKHTLEKKYNSFDTLRQKANTIKRSVSKTYFSYKDMEVIGYASQKGVKFGQISNAYGIAVDTYHHRVYVCDYDNNRIQVFFENLQPAFMISDSRISLHKKIDGPWGIDIEGLRVYVTQNRSHCINVYNLEGKFLTQIGKEGSGQGELSYPQGISVDSSNTVFVCDNGNCRIQVFYYEFKKYHYLMEIGGNGLLSWPRDIYAKRSQIYILDSMSPCLQVWTKDGSFLRKFLTTGPGKDVDSPLFFTLDEEGNILVSDNGHSVIAVFKPNGDALAFVGRIGDGLGLLKSPRGIALSHEGGILCVDEKEYPVLQYYY
ncbi:hypothetical protein LOD99_13906 [Oopsacas minuta]|uniref:Uncharacterized protein n=1 Tax=Oopsacas minuta TaxID=111878 RepID=A0AAV7KG40_9METZ|nr:hypothetical protein LOD99_13906 [Oopsacas minuta]